MDSKKNNAPFFILGRERSGTTMLRVNLNNHSNIYIPPESPFILNLYKKYGKQTNINPKTFIEDLKQDPYLLKWDIDYQKLTDELSSLNVQSFTNFCIEILKHLSNGKVIVGDKNPTYSLFGFTLHHLFTGSKFIWIIRDYRAQVNSMLKVNFERKIVSSLASRWVAYNKSIDTLKNKHPNQVLLIKYENLVSNPEDNYKKVCTFLGVDYESNLLNTDKENSEFYSGHHLSLGEKMNTKHIDEWKTELTQEQIKICEMIAGDYGEKFDYKKSISPNSANRIQHIFGIWYGKLYVPFIKLIYALPLSWRMFINRQIIYKNSAFWKELKEHYQS